VSVCLSVCLSVTIKELPMIVVPRRNVLVNNGDSALLKCLAQGIPQPNVTWYRDGVQVYYSYRNYLPIVTALSVCVTVAKNIHSNVRLITVLTAQSDTSNFPS